MDQWLVLYRMRVDPLVCSSIMESHPLHQLVCLLRSTASDETDWRCYTLTVGNKLKTTSACRDIPPSVRVRNWSYSFGFDPVKERGKDSPGFPEFVTKTHTDSKTSLKTKSTCEFNYGAAMRCRNAELRLACAQSAFDFRWTHPESDARKHQEVSRPVRRWWTRYHFNPFNGLYLNQNFKTLKDFLKAKL